MDINDLRRKRNELKAQLRAIVEAAETADRDLTPDEQAQFDLNQEQIASLDARIERIEQIEAEPVATGPRIPHAPGPRADTQFENIGQMVSAMYYRRESDPRLAALWTDFEKTGAAQNMGEGPAGGFRIPEEFRLPILEQGAQAAIVRPRAMVLPAGLHPDASVTMPALDQTGASPENVYGGVTVAWTGEQQEKPQTALKLRMVTVKPEELSARIPVTEKLLNNWPLLNAYLSSKLGSALAAAEDRAFMRGDGVGKPQGFLNSPALVKVARSVANSLRIGDVHKMLARSMTETGLLWIASRAMKDQLLQLQDNSGSAAGLGSFVFGNAVTGMPTTLLGHQLVFSQRSPALGALGDLALVDLSHYLIKDGSGPFIDIGHATGDFEKGLKTVRIISNVGGNGWLTEPFRGEDDYETSPFVALDVPAA